MIHERPTKVIGIFFTTALAMLLATSAVAAPPPDPYADAVDATTSGTLLPENAIGAPDGNVATVVNVAGTALVLDMGADEEGTGDLVVRYRGLISGLTT